MASYTDDQLAALMSALARGEKVVKFGDREIVYRSLEEIERAIAIVKASTSSNPRFSMGGYERD